MCNYLGMLYVYTKLLTWRSYQTDERSDTQTHKQTYTHYNMDIDDFHDSMMFIKYIIQIICILIWMYKVSKYMFCHKQVWSKD